MTPSYPSDRTVVCMKWGTLYSATYVNVLYNACRRYLSGPFEFVCFTDDANGLDQGIKACPIPDIGLDARHYAHGAWPKIGVFLAHPGLLSGRCLFIDLDTVLLDNLDALFEVQGDLVCIDSRPWRYKEGPPRTGTGIFAFDAGRLAWVVDRLRERRDHFVQTYGIEQDYLHGEVPHIAYWPVGWIASFKYHARRPLLLDRFMSPRRPGPPARVLAFHGKPRPIDLIDPPPGNWDVFPHHGSGSVDWMIDYWQRHQSPQTP